MDTATPFTCDAPECQQLALPEYTIDHGGIPCHYCSPYCAYEAGEDLPVHHRHDAIVRAHHHERFLAQQRQERDARPTHHRAELEGVGEAGSRGFGRLSRSRAPASEPKEAAASPRAATDRTITAA